MRKIFMFLLLGIFLISSASAGWDWDNTYDYNLEDDSVTIENAFGLGADLAYLKLTWGDTTVARGIDQHVGTFTLRVTESGYDDTIFDSLDLEDLKNGQVMTRGKQYKVKTYKNISVDDFETTCEDVWNVTNSSYYSECVTEEVGSHWEVQEEWTPINNPNFIFEIGIEYEIGVFVDVEEGDYGDWVPSLMGIEIVEWSTWTEDLNVNIVSYYKLDEPSGTLVIDSVGTQNGTNDGATVNIAGKINKSYSFDGIDDYIDVTGTGSSSSSWSVNLWVNMTSEKSRPILFYFQNTFAFFYESNDNEWKVFDGSASTNVNAGSSLFLNDWKMWSFTQTGTDLKVYLDGVSIANITSASNPLNSTAVFGMHYDKSQRPTNALMDEIGIWNRSLNFSEITQLWNGGDGITYIGTFGTPPSVTLTSPANNSNLTSANIDFIATVTDDIQVSNVTLFIDGIANESNISGVNGTYTFSKMISEGTHNWSILAINNQSLSNQSETRIFNLSIPPIFIDLLSPADSSTHNTPLVNMSCKAYKDEGVTQLNLTIDGVTNISITNTTIAENLTISQELNFSEGNYTWGCLAVNPSTSAVSSNRTFEVLYSNPVINLFNPANDSNILIENATFIFNASDINGIDNVSLFIDGVLNETNSSGVEGNYSFLRTLQDGFYNWSVRASSTLGKITDSATWFFTLHTETPEVNITAPSGLINYFKLGDNETLVYNISEAGENASHFDSCWYVYVDNVIKENDSVVWNKGTKTGWVLITDKDSQNMIMTGVFNFGTNPSIKIYKDALVKTGTFQLETISNLSFYNETFSLNLNENGWHYYEIYASNIGPLEDGNIDMFKIINPISLGGEEISLNCSQNTTNFTYINGENSITVFAKDDFGFIANDTSNWSYLLLEESQTFNTPVTETSRQEFELNITTLSTILSVNAILNYNGTEYTAASTCTTGVCNISTAIDIPLIVSGNTQNNTFFWELTGFTATSSFQTNTSESTQEVIEAQLGVCNATLNVTVLNFTAFDEQTLLPVSLFDFDGDFEFWTGTGTVALNTSISLDNVSSVQICVLPNGEDFKVNAIIEYDEAEGANYTIRNYYFDNDTVNNQTQDIGLGLLLATESTSFIQAVQDEDILRQPNVLIYTQRFYPGLGIFKTVQVSKTDDNGQTVGFFEVETADYRFVLKEDGQTLLITNQQKVIGTETPFTLTFTTGEGQDVAWEEFEDRSGLTSSLLYNKTLTSVLFTYQDLDSDFESARLIVEKVRHNSSTNLELCDISQTQSSGVLSCNMSGNETGSYIAKSFITRDGTIFLDQQIQFQIEDFSSAAGLLGLLLGWFVILVAAFMFKFNEIAGIIMVNLAIIATNLFGLIAWGYTFISAMVAISIIILVVLER